MLEMKIKMVILFFATLFPLFAGAKILDVNQTIYSRGGVASDNGQYYLTLQDDGNLVLVSQGKAVWASGTAGSGAKRAVMQDDGNFVLYTGDNKPVWNLATERPGATLSVQDDGNIVLYWQRAIWASNTVDANNIQTDQVRVLRSGERIFAGNGYQNGQYFLILQADGNLVLYKNGGNPIWNSGTAGRGVTDALMQDDGNFVLYSNGKPIWATNTAGNGGAIFAFQPDGNLVIYTRTVSWDRFNTWHHPDYRDHRGPGSGICLCRSVSFTF